MAADQFTKEEKNAIVSSLKEAELKTSGEIRVHIENRCKEDVLDRASGVFDMLHMQKTELRNGVLIYLALKDKKMAIIGDAGINDKVPDGFWDNTKEAMLTKFKEGKMAEGLIAGISKAGEQLKSHFPYQKDDKNELNDEISFGA